jgi:hypothetical protein
VSVTIYVEGGGNRRDIRARCRQGFTEFCRKINPARGAFVIVSCGGRNEAYDKFQIALKSQKKGDQALLLVDSEGPISDGVMPDQYLSQITEGRWELAVMSRGRVFLMVQAMEAWLLADREALAEFFGAGFQSRKLSGRADRVQSIAKDDLEKCLVDATWGSRRGKYDKGQHSFALLERIDPEKVGIGSSRALDFQRFLKEL